MVVRMASRPPLLLITIDGLRASALGAYGATAYETPALDEFATQALTHHWCYAETPKAEDLLPCVLEQSGRALVLSDDADWLSHVDRFSNATAIGVSTSAPTEAATSVGDTAMAESLSLMTEHLASQDAEHDLQWLHLRGMYGSWDAPAELYEDLLSEDDPEVEGDVAPATGSHDDPQSNDSCESRFAAACRYAAQVRTLDACLGGLLAAMPLLSDRQGVDPTVVIAGARGYPLGEHGQIGSVDPRLFAEQQHVPLLARAPASGAFAHSHTPVGLCEQLAAIVAGERSGREPPSPLILDAPDHARGLRTTDWYLRVPHGEDRAELYVKPDDRWDHNDVAKLCVEETEGLLAQLEEADLSRRTT